MPTIDIVNNPSKICESVNADNFRKRTTSLENLKKAKEKIVKKNVDIAKENSLNIEATKTEVIY